MRTRRRMLLALVIAALLGAGAGAYWAFRDDPPPQDEDLKVQRSEVPDSENGMAYFEETANLLAWPSNTETQEKLDAILDGDAWDGGLVEKTLQDNAKAIALWDQGMACRATQAPEVGTIMDTFPVVLHCLTMAQCVSLRSLLLWHKGRHKEAMEEAIRVCEFGRRIEAAKGCQVQYVVGMTITGIGLERLQQLAVETKLEPDELKGYAARLAAYEVGEQALGDALRSEYGILCHTVDDLLTGKEGILAKTEKSGQIPGPGLFYTFKPNRTKAAMGRTLRAYVSSIPKTYLGALPEIAPIRREMLERKQRMTYPAALVRPNNVGDMLCCILLPVFDQVLAYKCEENCSVRATRIILAIRAYEKKKGGLPAKLEDLVPEFIEAVPLDDFDGKPLRWSKEKKIVYSVGENLADDGGDETPAFVEENLKADTKELEKFGIKDPLGTQFQGAASPRLKKPRDIVFHLNPKDAPKRE